MIVINKEANQQQWSVRINEQIESGLTQTKWCEENNINVHKFRYWKSRMNKIKGIQSDNGFIAIKPLIATQNSSIRLTIGLASVDVNESANLDLLNDVVKVLMHYA